MTNQELLEEKIEVEQRLADHDARVLKERHLYVTERDADGDDAQTRLDQYDEKVAYERQGFLNDLDAINTQLGI